MMFNKLDNRPLCRKTFCRRFVIKFTDFNDFRIANPKEQLKFERLIPKYYLCSQL